MTGWSESNRRSELPPDWARIRVRIFARDGHRCCWKLPSGARCPRKATDVDHRNGPSDHRDSSLQSLCDHHHKKKTQREAWAGKSRRKKSVVRPVERHPGAIRRPPVS